MRTFIPLLLLLLAGCSNCVSLVPVCTESEAFRDDRIVGTWQLTRARSENERTRIVWRGEFDDSAAITFSRASASRYRCVITNETVMVPFACQMTKIGDSLFLDLQREPLKDRAVEGTTIRPHFVVRCIVSDGEIRLVGCKTNVFRNLLEKHDLPVTDIDSMAVFSGTTEQLRRFLSSHCSDLFPLGDGDVLLRPRGT